MNRSDYWWKNNLFFFVRKLFKKKAVSPDLLICILSCEINLKFVKGSTRTAVYIQATVRLFTVRHSRQSHTHLAFSLI